MFDVLSNIVGSSPVMTGCVILLMNLGGKYIVLDIPKGMDAFFSHPWVRKLTIFAIAFMATRNVKTSLLLLLVFILFSRYLFNENSRMCIPSIKQRVKEVEEKMAIQNDKKKVRSSE